MHGVEFGWRVHVALQEWTKAVDQKASIMLVFSTAIATLAVREVLDPEGGLHNASGSKLWAVRAMAIAFAVAALAAVSVVLPRLRRRAARREAAGGLIYFGHLRHRSIADIESALRNLDDAEALSHLAKQLKVSSAIAWRKHARLQLAVGSLVVAITLFAIAQFAL